VFAAMIIQTGKLYMFQHCSYLFKSRDCVIEPDDYLSDVDNQIVMILEQYAMKYGLHGFRLLTSEGLVGYVCCAERLLEKVFVKL
jgi:hypothetical protein